MRHLILVAAMMAGSAHAEFLDGNKLLADMRGSQMQQMSAIGYVMGAADAHTSVTVCPPNRITVGQAHDMVKQYLEDNPAVRHFSADSLVSRALSSVWPCKKGSGV